MRYLIFILFLIGVMGCSQQSNHIIGMKCFNLEKGQSFKPLSDEALGSYGFIRDTVFELPHMPLHKYLRANDYETFIALPYESSLDQMSALIEENAFIQNSRKDTLGNHYLLKKGGHNAYIFLKETSRDFPVVFIDVSDNMANLEEKFNLPEYYIRKTTCEEDN